MTKSFSKWVSKHNIHFEELNKALEDVEKGNYEANLGGHIIKKRLRFQGKGKSGSGRSIICYKQKDWGIFIHGFAKNEKSNLNTKELDAFKELAKVLLKLSKREINLAIKNGNFIEVGS